MDEDNMIATYVKSFITIIKLCERHNATLVYASSAATYGNSSAPNTVGLGETPLNIYGQSKLMMDNYVRSHTCTVPVIGIRYFNVYGPGEDHKRNMMSMVRQMMLKMQKNEVVSLFEYGEQMRDFVYVKDVAHCNLLCGLQQTSAIYNCGSGQSVSFNDIFNCISTVYTSTTSTIQYIKNIYSFYQDNTLANISNTTLQVKYVPQYTIDKGIVEYSRIMPTH